MTTITEIAVAQKAATMKAMAERWHTTERLQAFWVQLARHELEQQDAAVAAAIADAAPNLTDTPVLTEAEQALSPVLKFDRATTCATASYALGRAFKWSTSAEGYEAWETIANHLTAKAILFRASAEEEAQPAPVHIGAFKVSRSHFPHCPVRIDIPRGTIQSDMPVTEARALAAAITAQADAAEKAKANPSLGHMTQATPDERARAFSAALDAADRKGAQARG